MVEELPQEALDAVDDPAGHPVQTQNGEDTDLTQEDILLGGTATGGDCDG